MYTIHNTNTVLERVKNLIKIQGQSFKIRDLESSSFFKKITTRKAART